MTRFQRPTVLVLGVSGQIGRFVLEHLDKYPETLNVRVTPRRREEVAVLLQQGRDAVVLDLDNPTTFAAALQGVDPVFLHTGTLQRSIIRQFLDELENGETFDEYRAWPGSVRAVYFRILSCNHCIE